MSELLERGFDKSVELWQPCDCGEKDCDIETTGLRIGCSQCQAVAINGVPTHEAGCRNRTYECAGCEEWVRKGQECPCSELVDSDLDYGWDRDVSDGEGDDE